MVAVRCTRKLLTRLRVAPSTECESSTTKLGDWYADLLYVRPEQLILFVSESSRLPLVVPARGPGLWDRARSTLSAVLQQIEVPPRAIESELREMEHVQFGKTANRSVLGTINDFRFQLEVMLAHGEQKGLVEWSLHLARTPCSPIKYHQPRDIARDLLLGLSAPS